MLLRILFGGFLLLILCLLTVLSDLKIPNFFEAATAYGKYLKGFYPILAGTGGLVLLAGLLGISWFQRRKTKRALVKSQNLFRYIADLAYDWESWVNPKGQFVYTSPSCERVTGYPASQFMEDATLFERIVHFEDRRTFRDHLAESDVSTTMFRIVTANGQIRWLEHICLPMFDERGGFLGRRSSTRDVTARKNAEEKQLLAQCSLDSSINAVALSDLDGNLTYANNACLDMWGITSADEFIGKPAERFWERTKEARAIRQNLFINGHWKGELVGKRKDKSLFTAQISAFMVRDEAKKPLGLMASFIDITDRKNAEQALKDSEDTLKAMLQSIPDHVSLLDDDFNIVWANETAKKLLGGSIVGQKCYQTYFQRTSPCEDLPCHCSRIFEGVQQNHFYEAQMVGTDGKERHFASTVTAAVRNEAGRVTRLLKVCRDVTDWKTVEKSLRASEELHRTILTSISDALFITDDKGNLTFVGPNVLEIFKLSARQVWREGHIFSLLGGGLFALEDLRRQGEISNIERQIHVQGEVRTLLVNVKQVSIQEGTVLYSCRDITEKKQAEKNVQRLAYYDPLTGLPNRTLLNDHLERVLTCSRNSKKLAGALLVFDLDHFKNINDSLGHAQGDKILQLVARRIKAEIGTGDILVRWGGDEFVLLLTDVQTEALVEDTARRILELISEKPFELHQSEIYTSASVGIALFPKDGVTPDFLLKHADVALHEAKKIGRTYRFFSESLLEKVVERHKMASRLRRALREQEFFLAYQPQIDLTTGKITGVEALVRWQCPERGLVSPGEFIPVAEEAGLIRSLGNWVLRTACMQAVHWQRDGIWPLSMAVNLSARQFRQQDLVQEIKSVLQETGFDPRLLELEITESVFMENLEDASKMLFALKDLGISIAIDDFGTGYSSLGYLKNFPIDRIKIAQEFVKDILTDTNDMAIVEATIVMAGSLGLKIIAEGVETREQMDFLYERGCTDMQGFYFARPLTPGHVVDLFKDETIRPCWS